MATYDANNSAFVNSDSAAEDAIIRAVADELWRKNKSKSKAKSKTHAQKKKEDLDLSRMRTATGVADGYDKANISNYRDDVGYPEMNSYLNSEDNTNYDNLYDEPVSVSNGGASSAKQKPPVRSASRANTSSSVSNRRNRKNFKSNAKAKEKSSSVQGNPLSRRPDLSNIQYTQTADPFYSNRPDPSEINYTVMDNVPQRSLGPQEPRSFWQGDRAPTVIPQAGVVSEADVVPEAGDLTEADWRKGLGIAGAGYPETVPPAVAKKVAVDNAIKNAVAQAPAPKVAPGTAPAPRVAPAPAEPTTIQTRVYSANPFSSNFHPGAIFGTKDTLADVQARNAARGVETPDVRTMSRSEFENRRPARAIDSAMVNRALDMF